MKKILFTFIVLFTLAANAQTMLKDGIFKVMLENGIKQEIEMKFKVSEEIINKIKETDVYKLGYMAKTNEASKEFIEKNKLEYIEAFLKHETGMASMLISFDVKNRTSYSPIKDAKGFIWVNKEGEVGISFPFQAQNEYGNTVMASASCIIKWDSSNNKNKRQAWISE